MIITEKQLLILLDILRESLRSDFINSFAITHEQRAQLYSTILNQQSDKFQEIKA